MRKNIQILICDRCGKSVMLKEALTSMADGKSIYEPRPCGWMTITDTRNPCDTDNLYKEICPDCAKSYNNMIESFWKPKKIKEESDGM